MRVLSRFLIPTLSLLLADACVAEVSTLEVPDEADEESGPICNSEPLSNVKAGGANTARELWPGGEIPYVIRTDTFYPGSPSPATIKSAIDTWNSVLGGRVRFVPRTNDVGAFLSIQAGPAGSGGLTEYIGYAGLLEHHMWIANRQGTSTSPPEDASIGLTLHELGHAIGLHHEHQRPDRDRYLAMASSATTGLTQACYPSSWGQMMTYRGQPVGFFDYGSIMHYGSQWTRPAKCDNGTASTTANVNLFVRRDTNQPMAVPFASMSAPSARDIAGVIDLYSMAWGYKPFQPHAIDRGANAPLDLKITPSVSVFGSPAVATQKDGSLNLFALGTDSHVWMRWFEPAAQKFPSGVPLDWSSWYDLGACPSGSFVSEPAATSLGAGQVQVVVQGTTGLWSRTYSNGWGSWEFVGQPGGSTISAPALVAIGGTEIKVFVRTGTTSGPVQTRSFSAGSWRGDWTSLGGNIKGKPAAASWGPGHFSVIAQPATGGGLVEYRSTNGVINAWTTWNGALSSGVLASGSNPAVNAFGVGVLDVYVRGTDNALWQRYLYNGSWSSWFNLGGILSSDPASAAFSTQVHVFAAQSTGSVRGLFEKTYGAN